MNGPAYAPMELVKADMGLNETKNDPLLWDRCLEASRTIDRLAGRWFYPRLEEVLYSHPDDAQTLILDRDLLGLITVKTANGTITIPLDQIHVFQGQTSHRPPYSRIQVAVGSSYRFSYLTDPVLCNSIMGWWGYHSDYDNAWRNTGQTVQNDPLVAGDTVIEVTSAGGVMPGTRSRAFLEQTLIRVGSEVMFLDRRDETAETLTVVRGTCGTVAAQQVKGSAISRYYPDPEVARIALRLSAWAYKKKDAHEGDTIGYPELGIVQVASELPRDVRAGIEALKRRSL